MSLRERYRALSQLPDFESDPAQLDALASLEAATTRITTEPHSLFRKSPPPLGLWLWGPVGRGKTLLMDLFFEALPEERKQRFHFHRFMRQLHQDLKHLSGYPDPLARVAEHLARHTRVLCFDEFYVSDIADAMILGRLMTQLFKQGVFLVTTSNQHPDQLYADGLQRQRFLPAIEQLKQHCLAHSMAGDKDHRLRQLHGAGLFMTPPGKESDRRLMEFFLDLDGPPSHEHQPLNIESRPIPCRACNHRTAWFDFRALCEGPRSQLDYIALAERFDTLILSDIPALSDENPPVWVVQGTEDAPASATNQRRFLGRNDDLARRFIALVDELYDRSVKLIASCEVDIGQLYPAGPLSFAFERTRSRLLEMQSQEYLQRPRRT